MIFLTFAAVKFEAFWRLTISSNFGCLHVPVAGVELEGVDCATGVDGRNGVDIADRKLWLSRLQIVSCGIVSSVYCAQSQQSPKQRTSLTQPVPCASSLSLVAIG